MSRPKKRPEYDPEKIMKDLLKAISECYEQSGGTGSTTSLRSVAEEFGFTHLKARKLLITADAYVTEISDEVQSLKAEGKTIPEIMEITGLKRASVHSYLPYTKIVYNAKESSLNAERLRKFRSRQEAVRLIKACLDEDDYRNIKKYVWSGINEFTDYPLRTRRGIKYKYTISAGKLYLDHKEIIISRSTIYKALDRVIAKGRRIKEPNWLAVPDDEFIYPLFKRLGIIIDE